MVAPVRSEKAKATLMADLVDTPTEMLTVANCHRGSSMTPAVPTRVDTNAKAGQLNPRHTKPRCGIKAHRGHLLQPRRSQLHSSSLSLRMQVPLIDVGTEDGSIKLAEFLRKEHGPIDYVVSSLGGWWQKGAAGVTVARLHFHLLRFC